MIKCCGCMCGSTDNLIRTFLHNNGYQGWNSIDIPKGKEKSRWMLSTMPQFPEVDMLNSYLDNASKWAVIIGYDRDGNCKWADLTHGGEKSRINAEFIISRFA